MADDDEDRRRTDEMSLDELRGEIKTIDRELVELIARRTYVAETVAEVKRERDLPTTDERQEERVMERAGENAHHEIEALFKALARALDDATRPDERREGTPSTKGAL